MAIAVVRRRVRLEGGDKTEGVDVEREEMEVETREGKGPLREGWGGLMLTTLGLDRAGSDY